MKDIKERINKDNLIAFLKEADFLKKFPLNFQVVAFSNIAEVNFSPDLDLIITGVSSSAKAKKLKSFLIPHYPAYWKIKVISEEKTSSIKLSKLETFKSYGKNVYLFISANLQDHQYNFERLVSLMSRLRAPDGCPWDLEQTPDTIKGHLIEEAYEVVDAIERGDNLHLKEELGDLLLQIVFQAQMASEKGKFSMQEILKEIITKLKRRHPHLFSNVRVSGSKEVVLNWERIKKEEKEEKSFLQGIPQGLPSLLYAQKLQTKASRVGFDWIRLNHVFEKIEEEIEELKEACDSKGNIEDELGDLLFGLVNLARHLKIDAESALRKVARKFQKRFEAMEKLAEERNLIFEQLGLKEKDSLWEKVKQQENKYRSQGF